MVCPSLQSSNFLAIKNSIKPVRSLTCLLPRLSSHVLLYQRKNSSQKTQAQSTQSASEDGNPFGKQLKQDFRQKRLEKRVAKAQDLTEDRIAKLARWKLTVGLEVHAQLNTAQKLFSRSKTSVDDPPNVNVSFFDLAFPGSQPTFQAATLVPALRAASALNCQIEQESRFDRKHYFYQDQPAGYQITQYYKPFAKDGNIRLRRHDGVESDDMTIGIQRVQIEQDTAKSNSQPPSTTLIDFNRVGHPLVEIITFPCIHTPQDAAACARKIQSELQSANALFTGMEMGGLRVDVNVSVSPVGSTVLGQRVEIKNLSSFKAVEQAIIAERDRQIDTLEDGGTVAGETRGWTIGDTVTTKLRGKEGEVDYRYMPDPDIPPLIIDDSLQHYMRRTAPYSPDTNIDDLVEKSGLTRKDAVTLVSLDDGQRLDYFDNVVRELCEMKLNTTKDLSRVVANWVIHELGGLLSSNSRPFSATTVPAKTLATILINLGTHRITGASAKHLLSSVFNGDDREIDSIIDSEGMAMQHLSDEKYKRMAEALVSEHPDKVKQIQKGQLGKMKYLVGQMMRMSDGKIEAAKAESALKEVLNL